MTRDEMIVVVKQELRGLASQFEDVDYENACNSSEYDCGWLFPQSTAFKIKWLKERTKRHLLSYLMDASAYKFKYKNINLSERFANLFKRVESMDALFAIAQEENVSEFANADSFSLFPHQLNTGFAYEPQTGRDITYDDNQESMNFPSEIS